MNLNSRMWVRYTGSSHAQITVFTDHAEVFGGLQRSASNGRVELRHHRVGRMADDGTEHASDVAGTKRDGKLRWFPELVSRDGDHVLVEELHSALKGCKLHHGVGNLAQPQRGKTLVEAGGMK